MCRYLALDSMTHGLLFLDLKRLIYSKCLSLDSTSHIEHHRKEEDFLECVLVWMLWWGQVVCRNGRTNDGRYNSVVLFTSSPSSPPVIRTVVFVVVVVLKVVVVAGLVVVVVFGLYLLYSIVVHSRVELIHQMWIIFYGHWTLIIIYRIKKKNAIIIGCWYR